MLPVVWLVAAVVVAVLLTLWFTFTLTRLDRLHARIDAAEAALDAQLVRRAAALKLAARDPASDLPADERARIAEVAENALRAGRTGGVGGHDDGAVREVAENAVGRAAGAVAGRPLEPAAAEELQEAATRVLISRRFYNDAVRDTRSLRARRLPRLLRMAGHREMPQFFDIDDTVPQFRPADAEEENR
ncbi:hypothetical protein [Jatrophihabitans fulvus]